MNNVTNVTNTDVKLLGALINFSDALGVERPQTNDIAIWWDQALKEMAPHQLKRMYDSKIFIHPSNDVLIKMRNKLEQRIQGLKIHTENGSL